MKQIDKSLSSIAIATATAIALLLSACGSGSSEKEFIASARSFLAANDPKAATIQLKNALQKNPESPEVRYLLGKSLLLGGDAVGAEVE